MDEYRLIGYLEALDHEAVREWPAWLDRLEGAMECREERERGIRDMRNLGLIENEI